MRFALGVCIGGLLAIGIIKYILIIDDNFNYMETEIIKAYTEMADLQEQINIIKDKLDE